VGTGRGGNFGNTSGSKTISAATQKSVALNGVSRLPEPIQKGVKSFFKGSSNNYNNYSVVKNKNNTYTVKMENPGKVPGSKAIYYKIIDSNGKTERVYKETYDPQGNLVHRKEK
jgi:hypothetical protein